MQYIYSGTGEKQGVYLTVKEWEGLRDGMLTPELLESIATDSPNRLKEPDVDYGTREPEVSELDEEEIKRREEEYIVPQWQKDEVMEILRRYEKDPSIAISHDEMLRRMKLSHNV